MKKILTLLFMLGLLAGVASAQVRWDWTAETVGPPTQGAPTGGLVPLLAIPGATITFCQSATPGGLCNLPVTTYTSAAGLSTCPSNQPLTRNGSGVCYSTADSTGAFGAWLPAGQQFSYSITASYGSFGPYAVTAAGGSGGGVAVSSVFGRTGAVVAAMNDYTFSQIGGSLNLATQATGLLPIADGGTGTASPALVAGTNVTISGTWPNQTINSSGGASGFPITIGSTSIASSSTTTTIGGLTLTSPTFTAPALGTPASGVATNLTGLPLSSGVTGLLPITNGGTGTSSPALVAGTNITITGSWPNQTINSSGSSGISGLTTGYIPLAGSATTITANSHLDDGVSNTGAITSSEPVDIAGTGTPTITMFGSTSGSCAITVAATGGTLNLCGTNITMTPGGNASFAGSLSATGPIGSNSDVNGYLFASYNGGSIASASTIAPQGAVEHVTGTATINTITPPTGCGSSYACQFVLIADGSWNITTAGNVNTAFTATTGDAYQLTYDGTSKWYVTFLGSSTSGTVTSVGFTGGLISVGSPTTTPAFTVAGTSGGVPYFSSSSTWASSAALTQDGVVYGGGAGNAPASTAAGAAGTILTGNGSSSAPSFIDFPQTLDVPAANCNNATGGAGWSIGSGGTVTCRAGTNNKGGYVSITDTSSTFAQFNVHIPKDWDTGTEPYIEVDLSSTDVTSGHTIIPQIQVSCPTAVNGTTTDDATFATAHSLSTITVGASAVSNGFYTTNVQMNSTDTTGCVAGGMMVVQIGRATDTASTANFYSATITIPRKIVVQAN
jgi:hypothetical protein